MPWCEDCQMRHLSPPSTTVPGVASLHGGFGRPTASTVTNPSTGTPSPATATPAASSSFSEPGIASPDAELAR